MTFQKQVEDSISFPLNFLAFIFPVFALKKVKPRNHSHICTTNLAPHRLFQIITLLTSHTPPPTNTHLPACPCFGWFLLLHFFSVVFQMIPYLSHSSIVLIVYLIQVSQSEHYWHFNQIILCCGALQDV